MLKLKSERSQERFRQFPSATYFCKLNCWVLDKNISAGDCKDLHFRRLSFWKTFSWCKRKSRCFQSGWFILTQEKCLCMGEHCVCTAPGWGSAELSTKWLPGSAEHPEQSHTQCWDRNDTDRARKACKSYLDTHLRQPLALWTHPELLLPEISYLKPPVLSQNFSQVFKAFNCSKSN